MLTTHPSSVLIHGDRPGELIAAVEVKNREDLTQDIAVSLRGNLVSNGLLPPAPYFLLVSQDRGFLWVRADPTDPDAAPAYEFPMQNVLERRTPPQRRNGRADQPEFFLLVLDWLGELAWIGDDPRDVADEPERTLAASGFLKAIRGGTQGAVFL
jgi:hypothetical protein